MLSTNTNYLNVENHQTSNQQQETNENKIIYKNLVNIKKERERDNFKFILFS